MPRLTKSAPKYRRHKASGQAIVTLDGRDFYLGPYGTDASRREYDRCVAEWMANHRHLPAQQGEGLSIVELAAAYMRHAKAYYRKDGKPTSTMLRVKAALRVIKGLYGHTPAASFGPLALKAIQHRLVSRDKSRCYTNYLTEEIKRMFRWGVSQEMVPAGVHHALAAVSGLRKGRSEAREPSPVGPISDDVVNRTLPRLPPIVADMVRFQRLTGCRPGEVCGLRPCDVDTTGEVWRYTPASHKTEHHGKQRVIFVGPKAQDVLRPYLLRDKSAYCFCPQESLRKHLQRRHDARQTPVNEGNTPGANRQKKPKRSPGKHFTTASYAHAVGRGCELAFGMPSELRKVRRDLPGDVRSQRMAQARSWRAANCWSPNQLRHSAATEIRRQFGAEAAQTVLGHSNLNVTEIYAERDLTKAASIMQQVG